MMSIKYLLKILCILLFIMLPAYQNAFGKEAAYNNQNLTLIQHNMTYSLAETANTEIARDYTRRINNSVRKFRNEYGLSKLLSGFIYALFTTITFILSIKVINWLYNYSQKKIIFWREKYIKAVRVNNLEVLPKDRLTEVIQEISKVTRSIAIILVTYWYLTLLFSYFPSTRGIAQSLINYFIMIIVTVWTAFINYLPNLLFIIVIIILTYYAIKFLKIIFNEIKRGRIRFPGFYQEWSDPTFKITKFFVIALTLALIYPYLPGSGSEAFKGVSIFLGVLVSLGSSAAIANIVAGIILTYTRALNDGDRVMIGTTTGDVEERTLLVTRIRTIKNEIISIPNGVVLTSHIMNYSSSSQDPGLILHTSVSIGYKTPWKQVHELLISAALSTSNILDKPPPFVLQTKLNDFYVTYQINAYTEKPAIMQNTYSELHKNIQDRFNEAGVEIMSPHYTSIRDGNTKAIPEEYYSEDYLPQEFNLSIKQREG